MQQTTVRSIANILGLIAVIAVNAMASILPINGQTTGEISDRYPVLTTPAGYAFSIWGLIYTGLIAFAVYQALPGQRDNPRIRALDGLFLLNCLANIGWIFTWHYEILSLNVVMILGMLGTLLAIYLRLSASKPQARRNDWLLLDAPFSLYFGWVTVATIVNMTVALYALPWGGAGIPADVWAALLLAIGAGVATFIGLRRSDPVYPSVVVWAFSAIAVKQAATPLVANIALVTAGLAALVALAALVRNLRPGIASRMKRLEA
ncbi:MAG: tryptophan-rich sensory protein [Roseiflexaceae bacterium]